MNIVSVAGPMQSFVVEAGHAALGEQVVFRFTNGYGASVVRPYRVYGCGYELAVLKFESVNVRPWQIVYNTPVTGDVLCGLDEVEVMDALTQIKAL